MPPLATVPTQMPDQYIERSINNFTINGLNTIYKVIKEDSIKNTSNFSPKLERIKNEINSYSMLVPGWDGEESEAIPKQVVFNALSFVSSLGSFLELIDQDYIYPTGDGTIVIDFQNDLKDLVSVEIRRSSVGYFFQTQGHVAEVNSENFIGFNSLPPKVAKAIRKVWERKLPGDSNIY